MRRWKPPGVFGLMLLIACGGSREGSAALDRATRDSIAAAMERYMVAARAVDPAAIASFFTPTGVLFEPGIMPIQTPDSIRAFVASFPGVRVDSATAVADTIEIFGHTALLWGSYFERLAFSGQPTMSRKGASSSSGSSTPPGAGSYTATTGSPSPAPGCCRRGPEAAAVARSG